MKPNGGFIVRMKPCLAHLASADSIDQNVADEHDASQSVSQSYVRVHWAKGLSFSFFLFSAFFLGKKYIISYGR